MKNHMRWVRAAYQLVRFTFGVYLFDMIANINVTINQLLGYRLTR